MNNISNMSISSAKEVIKKLLAYQNEYDECPNVTWIPPKKSLSEKAFHTALKPDGFFKNGGILWTLCVFFTGEFTLLGVLLLIVNLIRMAFPSLLPEAFNDIIIFNETASIICGSVCFAYVILLILWLRRILNKINIIKCAQRECAEFDREYKICEKDFENRKVAERNRIKADFKAYLNQVAIPKWLLQSDQGFNRSFTTVLYKNTYSISEDYIRKTYRERYSNSNVARNIDPMWMISKKYITATLLHIIDKFPSLSTFKELQNIYVEYLKIKKDFVEKLTTEFNKLKNHIEHQEAIEYREDERRQREQKMHDELMGMLDQQNKILKEHADNAKKYYDRKEMEAYYRYLKR